MKRFLILVLATTLSACATTPTSISGAQSVPAERIFYKSPSQSDQVATTIFIRDSGLFGSALDNHLAINDTIAATLRVGEKVVLTLPAGEYVFGIHTVELLSSQPVRTIDQRLEAGKTYSYRISAATGGPIVQRTIIQAAR